ncbi:MAG: hypothetical protein HAW67_05250 [Endozoicomonadaceae bacterium]|nr:hypothetical protein [Endozoicomonadaceae bacterium]
MISTNAIELTEIALCIRVAEIEGHKVVSDSVTDNLVPCDLGKHDNLIPVNCEGKYLTQFNPIINDALCYRLMLKYDIKLSKNRDGQYVAMYSHCRGEENINPNKAICLAIISANKAKINA